MGVARVGAAVGATGRASDTGQVPSSKVGARPARVPALQDGCQRACSKPLAVRNKRCFAVRVIRRIPVLMLTALVLAACGHGSPASQSGTSTTSASTTSTIPSKVTACVASALDVSGSWEGATGSLLGGVWFTNSGQKPCFLVGYLTIHLVNQQGQSLTVQLRQGPPAAELNPPATPPAVELSPEKPRTAFVGLQWFNWCGPKPGTVSVLVTLASGAKLRLAAMGVGGSRCDDPRMSSFITEGPVQIPPS